MFGEIKKKLKNFLIMHMDLQPLDRFVSDINLDCTKQQKRVLIAYVDYFRASRDVAVGAAHTNRYELFQIIQCFIRFGYVIDVCAYDSEEAEKLIDKKGYDVVFGMGEVFRAAAKKNKDAYTVLYLTENPYEVSLEKERERIDYLFERRGIEWKLYRTGRVFEKVDEEQAAAIICMGDINCLGRLSEKACRILPSGFFNREYSNRFEKKKKENFLMLGTAGFVHKGADILVEVFKKHPEWQLFLCGHDISDILKKLGHNTSIANIHDCGYIDVKGTDFLKLVQKCVYILLPSCSEGTPTAVLTGMRHGMVPIVSREAGMGFAAQHCFFFDDYKIESIERKITEAVEVPMEQLEKKSNEIFQYANEQFTIEHFTEQLYHALAEILP